MPIPNRSEFLVPNLHHHPIMGNVHLPLPESSGNSFTCKGVPSLIAQIPNGFRHLVPGGISIQVPFCPWVTAVLGQAWKKCQGEGVRKETRVFHYYFFVLLFFSFFVSLRFMPFPRLPLFFFLKCSCMNICCACLKQNQYFFFLALFPV